MLSQMARSELRHPDSVGASWSQMGLAFANYAKLSNWNTEFFVLGRATTYSRFATNCSMSKPGGSGSSPWVPSEAWIEEFSSQCTEELWETARQYASRRAAAVRRVSGVADGYYERELVQDAIGDTALGVLRWDPTKESLKAHILDVIRTRTSHDYLHAHKFRHEQVDVLDGDADPDLVAEVEAALDDRAPSMDPELAVLATELLAQLRELAVSDPIVLRVLDAFASGAVTKADVMHDASLSDGEYHAARIRLGRLVAKLAADPVTGRKLRKGALIDAV